MLNNLSQVEHHDYAKNIFIGTVVANEDPLALRRVKVSIPNLFAETDPSTLPWVAPMFFGFVANGAGGGSAHLQPAVGSEVIVEFQMGSPLHGLYIASPIRPGNLPEEFTDSDWMWTYGWKDPAGNLFLVNTAPGNNSIRILHSSGTQVFIPDNGDIDITGVNDSNINIVGNVNAKIGGNVIAEIDGTANVTVKGDTDIQLNGNLRSTVQGTAEVTVVGDLSVHAKSKLNVTADSDMTVQANAKVTINAQSDVSITSTSKVSIAAPAVSLN